MIRLTPNPTFKADVRITVTGEESPAVVKFTFHHKTLTETKKWFEANEGKSRSDALGELIAGWEGVEDEHGAQAAYSRDALAVLLENYAASTGEITMSYLRELTESRIKN